MKKIFITLCVAFASIAMYAAGLENVRVYVNPGHGSWGPNDRPMATIPYPNLLTTGMPDTLGFYESNTNLWKCLELGEKLEAAGAYVVYSRTQSGPWPYEMVNGDYPTYNKNEYTNRDDYEMYNRSLSEISEEVETNGFDYFISVHSNAATEGTTTNYPLLLYRGLDDKSDMNGDSYNVCTTLWPYLFEAMDSGIDPYTYYSKTNPNVRGDIDFYKNNSSMQASDRTYPNGKTYRSSLGVLKHGCQGFLSEGYFHTYQPARHRALNEDYCRQEGIRYYRGIAAYYNHPAEEKGYIMGTVKDEHEKIVHDLFKYSAKTNDQWLPCNGAVVKLLKGGLEIAEYTVDNNYNGLFYFPDLDPGLYTLEISCEGYKALAEKYKEPIVVEANKTTYPMVFLENVNYVPDEIVYEDYPDLAPNATLIDSYNMEKRGEQSFLIEGTIKRTIGLGDSTIVLSHTADSVAHLYLIDHLTGNISTISTNGIVADKENAGEYLALSDIVYTCDGKLVGCNYIRCQYDDTSIDAGQKRGVVQFYKWDSLSSDPVKWISSTHSSNSVRSEQGYTLGISGPTEDCYIFYTGAHNRDHGVRFTELTVVDNQIVSSDYHGYNFYDEEDGSLTASKIGYKYLLTLSPRDTKTSWILDANKIPASERQLVGTNADLKVMGTFPEEAYGTVFTETNFIKYAGRILSIAAYEVEGKVGGVRVYDVTDGLDNPVLIKTNTDLDIPVEAEFAAATLAVNGTDMTIYLFIDNKVITFAYKATEQPAVKAIFAYNLNVSLDVKGYTFSFYSNENAQEANLILYKDGVEAARHAIPAVVEGKNEFRLATTALPGEANDEFTWAIELKAAPVAKWAKVHAGTKTFGRGFPTVDTYPESDFFGQIYVADRAGSSSASNGLYIYSPDYTLQNDAPYTGGQTYGSPGRGAVAPNGKYYFADWGDPHSGIWIIDPANPTATAKSFFEGSQGSTGIWSNNGVNIASSTSGIAFYGEGANLRLFAANEDAASPLVANSINIYNVGKEDGTMVESWGAAPSEIHAIKSMANGELAIQVTSHGYFVSQTRYAGNNTSDVPSLVFHGFDGTRHYNSGSEHADVLNGSRGSGFVVTADEKQLVIHNDNQEFVIFDIAWNGDIPTLTLHDKFKHGLSDIRQMSLDYAGNIICSGASAPLTVFAMPKTDNTAITPAKKTLTVKKLVATGEATAITLSAETLTLAEQETATLTVTATPEDVVGLVFTWTSDKPEVATVVDGVVTAVAPGEAKITVSVKNDVMTTPLTKECIVTVTATAATSVALAQKAATLYAGDQINLGYEIAPANATKPQITWTSSNEAVATVANGIVTAVAPGEAKIAISIQNTAMENALTDTCVITVAEYAAVTGVTLSVTDTLLAKGATLTLKETIAPEDAVEVLKVWSSDNIAVATVLNGVVTAIGAGETTIRLRVKSERAAETFEATCKVKVMVAVNAAMINEKEVTITEGETSTLTLQYAPKDAKDLTIKWISSNEEVATVENGIVTAVAPGEAEITVSLQNAVMAEPVVTAPCKVIVEKKRFPVTSVTLSAERDTLIVGNELTLEATIVAPEEAPEATITWTSSKEEVATVVDGVVTAVAEGEAIITVSVINADMTEAITATCTIIVEANPETGELTIEVVGIYYANETIHNPQGLALQVFNVNGQLVATGNDNMDMSHAPQGMYIVRCQAGTLKFVK